MEDCMLFVYLILFILTRINAFNHWIVTENGRIEAKTNGAFPLWRSYDLIALLQQEERLTSLARLSDQLNNFKLSLDSRWLNFNFDTDIEKRLYAENPDCTKMDKPLSKYTLTPIFVDHTDPPPRPMTYDSITPPDCTTFQPLDFSLFTLPHLKTLRDRTNVTLGSSATAFNIPLNIDIKSMLVRNKTDWSAYNIGVLYWQLSGNGTRALECARRAVHFAPRYVRAVALSNLGTLLQVSDKLGEAAIVLHMAVDLARTNYKYHLALGHVYTLLGDYNRAAGCYNNVLSLVPDMTWVTHLRYSLMCQKYLEETLQLLHTSLKQVLKELSEYIQVQEQWILIHNEIGAERAGHWRLNLPMDHLKSLWKVVEFQEQQLTKRMSKKKMANRVNNPPEKNQLKIEPLFDCNVETCPDYMKSNKPLSVETQVNNILRLISPGDDSSIKRGYNEVKKLRVNSGVKDQSFWLTLENCFHNGGPSETIKECFNQILRLYSVLQRNPLGNYKDIAMDDGLLDESTIENYYVKYDPSEL